MCEREGERSRESAREREREREYVPGKEVLFVRLNWFCFCCRREECEVVFTRLRDCVVDNLRMNILRENKGMLSVTILNYEISI